ncbi:MAG: hypothetical protein P4M11_08000 [Candidatus Pacebacteria bacterium]|nr:hypothetical protein [Candidatus Paceibacterota bacterium]
MSETIPTFKTWQRIKLGTGLNTGKDFYRAWRSAGHNVYIHTMDMVFDPKFSIGSEREREVDLVRVEIDELGLDPSPENTSIVDICKRAVLLGLSPCAEVAFQLILQAKPLEYPSGKIWWEYINLFIGMEPINNYGNPSVFFIGNLWETGYPFLSSFSANSVRSWSRYSWVFKRHEPEDISS